MAKRSRRPLLAVVWIPSQLQSLTGGVEKVTVPGATLRQVNNGLDVIYRGMKQVLVDENGRMLEFGDLRLIL